MGTEPGDGPRDDHSRAPLLEALHEHRRLGRYGFTPPAHRQGRGVDERVLAIIGPDAFRSDVLASPGLDDRLSRGGYLARDSHKSIVAGLIFSGVLPRWITPAGMPNGISPIPRRRSRYARPGRNIPTPRAR